MCSSALPLISCVTLSKSHHLSKPLLCYLLEVNNAHLTGGWEPVNAAMYIKCLPHSLGHKKMAAEVLSSLISIASDLGLILLTQPMWLLVKGLISQKKVLPVFTS